MSRRTILVYIFNEKLKWSLCFSLKPTYNSEDIINSLWLVTENKEVRQRERKKIHWPVYHKPDMLTRCDKRSTVY